MPNQFLRTQALLGKDALEKLSRSRVAVFGIGGVGGYVCEALVRSGVGAFDLIDNDEVSLTNINRQIIATHGTIGRKKTEVMRERMMDINPRVRVTEHQRFFLPENAGEFPFDEYDYVVDAIDTITAKLELAVRCSEMNIPLISSMGTGNKLDPCAFKVTDISKTSVCPLARVMRRELRKRGVNHLKVVYSQEAPLVPVEDLSIDGEPPSEESARRSIPGSVAFVPSVAGLIIAGEVIQDLVREGEDSYKGEE